MSEELSNSVQEINETVDVAPEAHENAEALSFDDLDAITDGRSASDLVKELNDQGTQKEPAEKNELSDQRTSDAETQQEIQEEIKKILARAGEEEMELDANTLFRHKVDGQDVDVNLQELLNNYSGKVSYDKKFQELNDERNNFEQEYGYYEENINELLDNTEAIEELMENNNYLGALEKFAEFSGMEPFQFKRELLAQLTPEMERRSLLSPEELRAEELAAQNEYLSRQAQLSEEQIMEQQEYEEVYAQVRAVQEQYGIEDADFRWCYDQLAEVAEQDGFEGEITVDHVAQYYYNVTAYQAAHDILNQTNPALISNAEVLDNLQQIIVDNPDFSEQDIVDIVNEVYGGIQKQASKNVSQKISNQNSSQPKKSNAKRDYEDYVDWEDF